MSDDKTTDPYNGELAEDADLASAEPKSAEDKDPKDEGPLDDALHLLPDGSGLEGDVPGSLP
jgi:hypothetical protein